MPLFLPWGNKRFNNPMNSTPEDTQKPLDAPKPEAAKMPAAGVRKGGKKSGGRGRETVFRVTYQNEISLIRIADNKAHLIISFNSIIIGVILTVSGIKKGSNIIENSDYRMWIPILFILLSSVLSMVFAIQAARPQLRRPKKNPSPEESKQSSLLFFANISQMALDEYMAHMKKLLKSRMAIHENMIIDIYNQARVLSTKYRLLYIAYQIFMYGIVIGVMAFILVHFL